MNYTTSYDAGKNLAYTNLEQVASIAVGPVGTCIVIAIMGSIIFRMCTSVNDESDKQTLSLLRFALFFLIIRIFIKGILTASLHNEKSVEKLMELFLSSTLGVILLGVPLLYIGRLLGGYVLLPYIVAFKTSLEPWIKEVTARKIAILVQMSAVVVLLLFALSPILATGAALLVGTAVGGLKRLDKELAICVSYVPDRRRVLHLVNLVILITIAFADLLY